MQHVLNVLTPIWTSKTETASKLRERIGKYFLTQLFTGTEMSQIRRYGAAICKLSYLPLREFRELETIPRSLLRMLRRLDINDGEWSRAMDAISDAVRVTSSKTYIRFYEINPETGVRRPIALDLAGV